MQAVEGVSSKIQQEVSEFAPTKGLRLERQLSKLFMAANSHFQPT